MLAHILGLAFFAFSLLGGVHAAEQEKSCRDDAMLVIDASGSMAGGVGGNNLAEPRFRVVRRALAMTLPALTSTRDIGLIVYGPGPYNVCQNIDVRLRPQPRAADQILAIIDQVVPAGRTPLANSIAVAAEVLAYRTRPATVVVLTDGEETCGGDPCATARQLKHNAPQLTIHVIGWQLPESLGTSATAQARCMADATSGIYANAQTSDDLVKALHRMLGCPEITRLAPDPRCLR